MIPPMLTPTVADQRRADLRAWATACGLPRHRAALAATFRAVVTRLRLDASRMQLGQARVDCATC